MKEDKPPAFYWFPYMLSVLTFSYACSYQSVALLVLAIMCAFTACMKPVYDWQKRQDKENGDTNGKS